MGLEPIWQGLSGARRGEAPSGECLTVPLHSHKSSPRSSPTLNLSVYTWATPGSVMHEHQTVKFERLHVDKSGMGVSIA